MGSLEKYRRSSTLNNCYNNDNKSKIEKVPQEIFHLIFIWVTGTDIKNISKVAKPTPQPAFIQSSGFPSSRTLQSLIQDEYLWSVMTKTRFPRLYGETILEINNNNDNNNFPQENPISWRDIYMSKDDNQLSVGRNMGMIHARLPYWETVPTNESIYGVIAQLHYVYWFDVHGIIEGVPQEKYRIQWRMRLAPSAISNRKLEFKAYIVPRKRSLLLPLNEQQEQESNLKDEAVELLSYTTPSRFYLRDNVVNDRWILLTIPSEIEIKNVFADIHVSHEKHTNSWKGGIELDWVRLQPSSEVSGKGLLGEDDN